MEVMWGSHAASLRRTLRLLPGLAERRRFMTMCRTVAMFCGPLPVRRRDKSSRKMTSRTQCKRFSICQWLRRQGNRLKNPLT